MYKKFLKRTIDIIVAIFALLLLSPLFLIIMLLIFFEFKGPIFFFQNRAGINGKPFKIIKFRTMIENFKEKGLSEENAITRLGSILRKTSLDETPEFLNVLYGNMSLIGPRPLLIEYVPRYNEKHIKRLSVRPGITGLAQVSGRNSLSWIDKFDMDVEYIENISFLNDIKIFTYTIKTIFLRNDVNSSGGHMSEFKGYSDES